ncbi:MAG: 2-oxoglutarate dehydrogenase E1 component, partial [Dongiaceae bacterium]
MTNTSTQNTFLYGANAAYVAEIYQRYMQNPGNVDASWVSFFKALNDNDRAVLADFGGASWNKYPAHIIGAVDADAKPAKKGKGEAAPAPANDEAILDSLRARALIRAFRVRGHLQANLDPLGLMKRDYQPDLDPATYGFSDSDYDRPIFLGGDLPGVENVTLRQILEILRATYSGSVGVEFMHIQDPLQRAWIQSRIESRHNYRDDSIEGKKATLEKLTAGEIFEKFLHTKYTGTKRFGLEGGESLIPALETVLQTSAKLGVVEAIFGMAHRGRLSTLINILAKPLVKLLAEFEGRPASPTDVQGSGDVKYHLGTSNDR